MQILDEESGLWRPLCRLGHPLQMAVNSRDVASLGSQRSTDHPPPQPSSRNVSPGWAPALRRRRAMNLLRDS